MPDTVFVIIRDQNMILDDYEDLENKELLIRSLRDIAVWYRYTCIWNWLCFFFCVFLSIIIHLM